MGSVMREVTVLQVRKLKRIMSMLDRCRMEANVWIGATGLPIYTGLCCTGNCRADNPVGCQPKLQILSDVKSSGCEEVRLELHASRLQLSGKAGDNCSKLQVSLRGSSHPGAGGLCINVPDKPVMANFKAGVSV